MATARCEELEVIVFSDRSDILELQTSSPSELKLLGKIQAESVSKARELEQSLHKTFDKYRVRGEWFEASVELLDYIAKL
jgi:hypothetical protein